MGSGTKIALVTFLILMVVVVAIFVQRPGKVDPTLTPQTAAVAGAKKNAAVGSKPAVVSGNTVPGRPVVQPKAVTPSSGVAPRSPLAAGTPGGGAPGVTFVPGTTGVGSSAGSEPRPALPPGATPPPTLSVGGVPTPGAVVGTAPRPLASTSAGDSLPLGGGTLRSSAEGRSTEPKVGVTLAPAPGTSRPLSPSPLAPTPLSGGGSGSASSPSTRQGATSQGNIASGAGVPSGGSGVLPGGSGTTESSGSISSVQAVNFPIEHKVETGDGYWKIAAKYWGQERARFHKQIASANGDKRLLAGMTVKVPAPPELPVARPANHTSSNVPPRTGGTESARTTELPAPGNGIVSSDSKYDYYVVKKGDTLEGLAKRFYGGPGKKSVIEAANPELRYTTLREKAKIKLPKKSA